jgi:checkpoint serine/threonine-protein kinase
MMSGPIDETPSPAPVAGASSTTKKRKALGEVKSSAPLSRSADGPSGNARLQPFVDGEDGGVEEPGNEWPEFGSRVARTKENLREVTRAGDAPYKLAKPPPRQASEPFIPFQDEVSLT